MLREPQPLYQAKVEMGETVSQCIHLDIKRQAESWGQLWDYQGTTRADVVITKKMGIKCPLPLSAEHIRIASSKFKPSTVSADKLHPKHISILSHNARKALARLYTAFELAGNFP